MKQKKNQIKEKRAETVNFKPTRDTHLKREKKLLTESRG